MFIIGKGFRKEAVADRYSSLGLKDIGDIQDERNRLVKEANARTGSIWCLSLACGVLSFFILPNIVFYIIATPLIFIRDMTGIWWLGEIYPLFSVGVIAFLVYLFLSKSKIRISGIEKGTAAYCASIGLTGDAASVGQVLGSDTTFLLGRVQSANEETITDTHVTIGKDVFGNTSGSSYNTYSKRNTAWLYDLVNKKEVKYSGVGGSIARPGHDVGVAKYRGRAVLEYNLSTGNVYNFQAIQKKYLNFRAIFLSLGSVFLGWVLFPICFMMMLFSKSSGVGFYVNKGENFPGGETPQVMGFMASSIVTAVMYYGFIMSVADRSLSWETFSVSLVVGLVVLFFVHRWGIKRTLAAYTSYLSYCENELKRRYDVLEK